MLSCVIPLSRRPRINPSPALIGEIAALCDSGATRAGEDGGNFLAQFRGDDDGDHVEGQLFQTMSFKHSFAISRLNTSEF
jgi:hypothetical protein